MVRLGHIENRLAHSWGVLRSRRDAEALLRFERALSMRDTRRRDEAEVKAILESMALGLPYLAVFAFWR
jgi:hypothetical protein